MHFAESFPHRTGLGAERPMPIPEGEGGPIILLTGGSGYVGGRLIPLLERRRATLRCLARDPEKMRPRVRPTTEVVRGDVLDRPSLDEALRGVHTAYYLVHLMSGRRRTSSGRTARRRRTSPGPPEQAGVRRHHLPRRPGRRRRPEPLAAPPQPPRGRRDPPGFRRRDRRVPGVDGDRGGQPVVRVDEVADRPAAGDALPPLAHDADPADRRGRRAGLPPGGAGPASGREPHLRGRRHGRRRPTAT